MIKYIVGTHEKGNLFKDGRSYKSFSAARRVATLKQGFVTDRLIVIKIEEEDVMQKLQEQLDVSIKHLIMAYNWGLHLYESDEFQEMEDEYEKENMKDDLDIVHSFLNKQKDEV